MNSFSVITGFNQNETMGMKSLEQGHNTAPPGDEIYGKGPDKFHPYFIKETKDQLKKPLCIIFKKSVQESKIPEIWKMANVAAIFKKGDKKLPENYRPISLHQSLVKYWNE